MAGVLIGMLLFRTILRGFNLATTAISSAAPKKAPTKKVKYLKASVARKIIETLIPSSQIFTVTFDKKNGGGERVMNCRRGVSAHLSGTSTTPRAKHLITVFDLKLNDYRSFCLDAIKSIKAVGITFTAS